MTCEKLDSDFPDTILAMIVSLRHFLGWLVGTFRSREDLVLENLALRRQLMALHAQQPRRMDLESQTIRRAEACQQRDSHLDLSSGCREDRKSTRLNSSHLVISY